MYGWVSMRAEDRLTKPVSRCRIERNRLRPAFGARSSDNALMNDTLRE